MNWPTQRECDNFYGNPRGRNPSQPSATWESQNLTFITPPFKMYYDGKLVTKIKVHKKCADAFSRVFNNLLVAANGSQTILDEWGVTKFGGSYNFRLMRNGTALSMHSYGCAIDLDPANNGLGDKTPRFANYPQVLKAFKDEGATWGGDWNGDGIQNDTPADGMHWQFARVR